jgi:hypothetical protein
MSFSAIPQQLFGEPPRVRIDVGTDDPSKPFTSLQILRDGKPIREQPYVGGSVAVVFDYEAPFGVPVTYSAVGTIATVTTLHNETWANLTGWTTISDTPSVAGSHFTGGKVERALTFPTSGRLVSQGLVNTSGSTAALDVGPIGLIKALFGSSYMRYGADLRNVAGLESPFTATWDANSVTLTTTAGSFTLARGTGSFPDKITAGTIGAGSFVEDFVLSSTADTPFTATATTTADFQGAWLLHPSQPSLSLMIEPDDHASGVRFIEASSGESKSSAAQRTIHRPVGRRKAVVITSGPRQADEWTLVVEAKTIEAKNAIRALVDDQTPLLLRTPPSMGTDLPDDWYSVGDLTVTRVEVPAITQVTTISMPLTPVDEPVVRQGALWSYGSDLLANATYAEARAALPTYLSRLTGTP